MISAVMNLFQDTIPFYLNKRQKIFTRMPVFGRSLGRGTSYYPRFLNIFTLMPFQHLMLFYITSGFFRVQKGTFSFDS